MLPRVTATVDLAAIRHNFGRVRQLARGRRVMAAIKADAYGHGAVQVARALADADALAVACLEEAVVLREAGIAQPIVLLEGVLDAAEAREAAARELTIVVHDDQQLAAVQSLDGARPVPVWIKLDTGMNRLGFVPERAPELLERLAALPAVRLVGWMSHLACADDRESGFTTQQLARFLKATEGLPGERSLANSAAVLHWPDTHLDWVRPGLMVYGASPFPGATGAEHGLRPAMRLAARILSIREVRAGDRVGYGARWRAVRDARLAIVSAGYADGVRRSLPVQGLRFPVAGGSAELVGTVSMDMLCLDLYGAPAARVGDWVTLWGEPPAPAIEQVAAAAGTIPWELMCALTGRVRMVWEGGAD